MKSKILMSLLVIVVSISMMVSVTMAWFTDSATSTGNKFAAGTLKIDVNDSPAASFSLFDSTLNKNLAPGDVVNDFTVKIDNSGSLNFGMFKRFTLGAGTDMEMASMLEVKTYKVKDWSTESKYPGSGGYCDFTGDPALDGAWNKYDANKDEKVTLDEFVAYQHDDGGGWTILGLKKGYSQEVVLGLEFLGEADNDVQGKFVKLEMEVYAAQATVDAIQQTKDDYLTGLTATAASLAGRIATNANSHFNDARQPDLP